MNPVNIQPTALPHKEVQFAWLKEQALDTTTRETLDIMETIRVNFIATGERPKKDADALLRLCHATLSTTLNGYYSTVYAYQEMFLHKEHENWEDVANLSGIVIDVGANEGLYAIATCKKSPDVEVYCIEPNPIALARLEKNLALNGLSERCHIIPSAVWSQTGKKVLRYLPFVTTNASLEDAHIQNRWLHTGNARTITVPADTLDHLLHPFDLEKIGTIKIDTEGSEVEVLHGAATTLAKASRVVIEYHSDVLRHEVIACLEAAFTLTHETHDAVHGTQSCGNLYFTKKR